MAPRGKKTSDPTWDHCVRVGNNNMNLRCKHCGKEFWGGVNRMKHHLAGTRANVAPCPQCPDEVRQVFQGLLKKGSDTSKEVDVTSGSGSVNLQKEVKLRQPTINEAVKDRDAVWRDIARFLYGNGLAFNLVKGSLFTTMIDSVAGYGRGFRPPSYHDVRVPLLKQEKERIEKIDMEKYRQEWKRTGCTLMSDGWTDGKSRSITNFLVNSPSGTVFLESVDTSDIIKSGEEMFRLLDSYVQKVGEENVVQVVTDAASAYVSAGQMLEEKRKMIFWSPCSAHCLNNMLKDIGDLQVHKDTIRKCRGITVFIYRHSWVLNLMRNFTEGRELTRPGVTRFATNYLTLKSILEQKVALRAMFASREFQTSAFFRRNEAVETEFVILHDEKFWKQVQYCLKCVLPLVKVLRLVDGDVKPAMGYIYEAMDRAKEQIENNFDHVRSRYQKVWDIIDSRWQLQLHRPLHAAAYFLNPK